MQETRVLTNYPAYKIHKYGSVYKVADNSEVNTMKKPDSRGLARIRLYKDGKSYKETIQDLLLSVFTEEEIFGDGKTVFDTDETDDMTESDTEFFSTVSVCCLAPVYPLTNKEKFINNWIEKYYNKDADDEYGNLDYVKAEAQREYEPIELDEWAGDQMEQYELYKYSGLITKDEFEKGYGVYSFNLENTIFEL